MHDDAAYVPRRACTSAGPRQDPVRRFEAWMREHADLTRRRARRAGARRRGSDRRGRHARRGEPLARSGHARGWRLRRLRRSGGQPPLSLPRYRPWFYDLVRDRERAVPAARLPAQRVGARERARARAAWCSRRCTAPTSTRWPSASRSSSGASARWPSTSSSSCPLIGRVIAHGRRLPCAPRACRTWRPTRPRCGMLRDGDMLLVFPEGTRNRDGKARPQLGAARLALEAGVALVPVSIARQRPHQAAAAALPEDPASTTASRSRWTTCRQTICGARRTRRRSAGPRPIDAGLAASR